MRRKSRTQAALNPNVADVINNLEIPPLPQVFHPPQLPNNNSSTPPDLDPATSIEHDQMQVDVFGAGPSSTTPANSMASSSEQMIQDTCQLYPQDQSHDHHPLHHVDLIPSSPSVGQDETFQKVCSFLSDDNSGIIGIYGMGGVGKTTLMKRVHSDFQEKCNFDVIIWILVSQEVDERKLLRSIMDQIGLQKEKAENEQARIIIYKKLLKMKFLILIDDLWGPLDMVEDIGIPYPTQVNKSKVIFTTRSGEVCYQMHAHQQVKVNCLEKNDSQILFKQHVGERALDSHPRIRGLAKLVAEECGGLPLALKVIGGAMAGKRSPEEWECALATLRKSPTEIAGTEKRLFSCLKFSYDALPNQKIKDCFLYCCMFPEDWAIDKKRLIDYWMGEGFLGINESLMEAKNTGQSYINTLTAAFLLESYGEKCVKMHDVIRDMALWIVSDNGSKFFVHPRMPKLQIADRWKEAHRIFLLNEEGMPEKPVSSKLSTLIVRTDINLIISYGLFDFMPLLRVLDLSNSIIEVSPAIGQLVNLRYLRLRAEQRFLPWLGNLTKLEILDLSYSRLLVLPDTIGQLVELRHLNLEATVLNKLPAELRKLSKLEMLNLRYTGLIGDEFWPFGELKNLEHLSFVGYSNEKFTTVGLCKLAMFQNLKHLEICTDEISSLQGLSHCLRTLWTHHCPSSGSMDLLSLFKNMDILSNLLIKKSAVENIEVVAASNINTETTSLSSLSVLRIDTCHKLTNIEVGESSLVNLRELYIVYCNGLKHINGLKHLQQLEVLIIKRCGGIEEVISRNEEETQGSICFPRLKKLIIHILPNLKSICSDTVSFPSLEEFSVSKCPMEKLPLGLKEFMVG